MHCGIRNEDALILTTVIYKHCTFNGVPKHGKPEAWAPIPKYAWDNGAFSSTHKPQKAQRETRILAEMKWNTTLYFPAKRTAQYASSSMSLAVCSRRTTTDRTTSKPLSLTSFGAFDHVLNHRTWLLSHWKVEKNPATSRLRSFLRGKRQLPTFWPGLGTTERTIRHGRQGNNSVPNGSAP